VARRLKANCSDAVVVAISMVLTVVVLSVTAPDVMTELLTEVIAAVVADLLLQAIRSGRNRTPKEYGRRQQDGEFVAADPA
jgi:hypothetical protein